VKVTILMDNRAHQEGLAVEHGLSIFIEHRGFRLLFDTGKSAALIENAAKLGVDLSTLDAVVLSHGHYDHTGGLAAVLARNRRLRVYLHPRAMMPRYGRKEGRPPHPNGMPVASAVVLMKREEEIAWTAHPTAIAEGIHVTGPVPRVNDLETPGGPFFDDAEGVTPDTIEDDQSLWIETEQGIVVVAGCAHAGIVNTMDYIAQLAGVERMHAVIGGLHLGAASNERLEATVAALRRRRVERLLPLHCTGDQAAAYLAEQLPGIVEAPCAEARVRPGY
jgi:7,8-dihydropterin-6-yl-methyl-4-(beta-D-ribofuranosyl)aminobenzene 5'-phosphate synthase